MIGKWWVVVMGGNGFEKAGMGGVGFVKGRGVTRSCLAETDWVMGSRE